IFSVIYAALMSPFPYRAVDRIVRLTVESKADNSWVNLNGGQIQRLRQSPVVESVLAMEYHALTLTGSNLPGSVNGIALISTGFADLGVPPLFGRGLLPSDAMDGHDPEPVVVLAYKFWRKEFSSDPEILGKTPELDPKSYLIVGVAAPPSTWYNADVSLPLKLTQDPAQMCITNIRLRQGVTPEAAGAALQPLIEQFAKDLPRSLPEHFRVRLEGL